MEKILSYPPVGSRNFYLENFLILQHSGIFESFFVIEHTEIPPKSKGLELQKIFKDIWDLLGG